tara:strand:+ start:207 stop:455 length:249 start_codon:yes stop_codon:yes gene_type:complete
MPKRKQQEYVIGDLVQYVEYFYYPGIPTSSMRLIENGDIGLVIDKVDTMYGDELYDVYWLKAQVRCYTATLNLKMAYLEEPV